MECLTLIEPRTQQKTRLDVCEMPENELRHMIAYYAAHGFKVSVHHSDEEETEISDIAELTRGACLIDDFCTYMTAPRH